MIDIFLFFLFCFIAMLITLGILKIIEYFLNKKIEKEKNGKSN